VPFVPSFFASQARDALERVRAQTHVDEPIFQGVMREALVVLTESGASSRAERAAEVRRGASVCLRPSVRLGKKGALGL
jgi:hypothetical protein